MTNLTLSREMQNMAERLAENAHDIWAKKKKEELLTNGGIIAYIISQLWVKLRTGWLFDLLVLSRNFRWIASQLNLDRFAIFLTSR